MKSEKTEPEAPLPIPEQEEEKDDFIRRCMADEFSQEFPEDQRRAICESQWEKRNSDTNADDMENENDTNLAPVKCVLRPREGEGKDGFMARCMRDLRENTDTPAPERHIECEEAWEQGPETIDEAIENEKE